MGRSLVLAFAALIAIRWLVIQSFYIPSESMEHTLNVGDRIAVSPSLSWFQEIKRGDVVVFSDDGLFFPEPTPSPARALWREIADVVGLPGGTHDVVKRVIGMPGDTVACCDDQGRVTVNGEPLDEPYLYPGDVPSVVSFSIKVPTGRLWVMGDHRSHSADSRAHLGDPGGGTIGQDRVIGRVLWVYWPLNRIGVLPEAVSGE